MNPIAIDLRGYQGCFDGMRRYGFSLTRHLLARDRHTPYLLLLNRKVPDHLLPPQANCRFAYLSAPPWSLEEQRQLPPLLKKLGARLYYSPDYTGPVFSDLPLWVTWHDISPLLFWKNRAHRTAFEQLIVRTVGIRAQYIMVTSRSVRRELREHYGIPSRKMRSLPIGVHFFEPPVTRQHLRAKYGLEKSYILTMGNGLLRKNMPAMWEAYRKLPAGIRGQFPLVAVGDFPRKKLPRECVPLTGIPDREWTGLLKHAAVFVYPSLYEGFGLPPLEAMTMGCPAVAADHGALRENLAGAALLVDTRKPAHLTRAMVRIIEDASLRSRLVRLGIQRARRFSYARSAAKLLRLFRDGAGNG